MFAQPPRSDPPGRQDTFFVRVLGPVDCVVDGLALSFGSRMERKLLGALALSANQAASSSRLAEILWGDDPPASRDNTLQTYVSRLRHEVGANRITSSDNSYTLHVARDELDALLFEARVADAAGLRLEPERCLDLCNQARQLWRGVPFGGFAEYDPFRLEAVRLDGIRMFALELSLECRVALGSEAIAVSALEALVEEYPYRERLWQLLVAALALSGRRVEALRACGKLRDVLAEIGLEPTADFKSVENEILADDPEFRIRMYAILTEQARR